MPKNTEYREHYGLAHKAEYPAAYREFTTMLEAANPRLAAELAVLEHDPNGNKLPSWFDTASSSASTIYQTFNAATVDFSDEARREAAQHLAQQMAEPLIVHLTHMADPNTDHATLHGADTFDPETFNPMVRLVAQSMLDSSTAFTNAVAETISDPDDYQYTMNVTSLTSNYFSMKEAFHEGESYQITSQEYPIMEQITQERTRRLMEASGNAVNAAVEHITRDNPVKLPHTEAILAEKIAVEAYVQFAARQIPADQERLNYETAAQMSNHICAENADRIWDYEETLRNTITSLRLAVERGNADVTNSPVELTKR